MPPHHRASSSRDPLSASSLEVHWPSSDWKRRFRRQLTAWFQGNARDLPWRRTRDLYCIWVSEVMLQQTQVATVIPYYKAFLESFPTLNDLAAADEHEVLRHWEGLGYYRAARQLHQAACQIVARHQGQVPEEVELLRGLPGIGRYTAGAILSIGRDQQLPILEANTVRLYSRLLGYFGDPRSTHGQRTLWEFAERLVPRRDAGRFNQALMELGSEICTPKQPKCTECPVRCLCPTNQNQWHDRIPLASKRVVYEDVREVAVVVWRKKRFCFANAAMGSGGPASGMYLVSRAAGSPAVLAELIVEETRRLTGVQVRPGAELLPLKHGVTRYRITLDCFHADYLEETSATSRDTPEADAVATAWVTLPQCATYPLSVTGRKLIGHLTPGDESNFTR